MKVIAKTENTDVATVYIAKMGNGKPIEFVESVQPPIPRDKKWVLIVSTLFGCPVRCRFCDAGEYYQGKLTKEEILAQIDYMVKKRFPDRKVPVEKFKIQFARMGEPAFNPSVLDVLEDLPDLYDAPGLLPTLSTIAPKGSDRFFNRLLEIKNFFYKERFQLQFSIHTTNTDSRDWVIPIKKWDFKTIAAYGERFYREGERKITLNFALTENIPVDAGVLCSYFDPTKFLIKMTPLNPTHRAMRNKMSSRIRPEEEGCELIEMMRKAGYEVILSIGQWEENRIGSNCGQFVSNTLQRNKPLRDGYTYSLKRICSHTHE